VRGVNSTAGKKPRPKRSVLPPFLTPHTSHLTPRRPVLAFFAAVLLILSFPNGNQPWCAWVALVPWLLLLDGVDGRRAFWWSYAIGVVFFLGSIYWLVHVTVLGLIILSLYLGLFFAVFGWSVRRLLLDRACGMRNAECGVKSHSAPRTPHPAFSAVSSLFAIPSAWIIIEWVRSHLLTGFGWNLLAYSQTPILPIIQLADVTGAWGVSWLLVAVNVALARLVRTRGRARNMAIGVLALVAVAWAYGLARLARPASSQSIAAAVVQGSIPQEEKWDEVHAPQIVHTYQRLTRQAAATHPQIIIWPETSVPGYLGLDEPLTTQVRQLAEEVQTPLLVGAPMGGFGSGVFEMTNSAALMVPGYGIQTRYDKLHLVPFGEFIPLESMFPWMRDVLPPIGAFVAGRNHTLFVIPVAEGSRLKAEGARPDRRPRDDQGSRRNAQWAESQDGASRISSASTLEPSASSLQPSFGVLICFEDVFPEMARRHVLAGAKWLVTITNDAWFGPTAAAYQHAQASTFRAVELRVPMVRAANTGWSGCIDDAGRWVDRVHDAQGRDLFVQGVVRCELPIRASGSLYARWGDWFVLLSLLILIACGFLTHQGKVRGARRKFLIPLT